MIRGLRCEACQMPRDFWQHRDGTAPRLHEFIGMMVDPSRALPPPEASSFTADFLGELKQLHRISCVYFLIFEGRVVYVGQSTNLIYRLTGHIDDGKPFDSVLYIKTEFAALNATEREWIRKLTPELNRAWLPK